MWNVRCSRMHSCRAALTWFSKDKSAHRRIAADQHPMSEDPRGEPAYPRTHLQQPAIDLPRACGCQHVLWIAGPDVTSPARLAALAHLARGAATQPAQTLCLSLYCHVDPNSIMSWCMRHVLMKHVTAWVPWTAGAKSTSTASAAQLSNSKRKHRPSRRRAPQMLAPSPGHGRAGQSL